MKKMITIALSMLSTILLGATPLAPVSVGGLQMSLTTSGAQIQAGFSSKTQSSFNATASLNNRSLTSIPIVFANKYLADTVWLFELKSSTGRVVWSSSVPIISGTLATSADMPVFPIKQTILPARSLVKTVAIPLFDPQKGPFAAGVYVLEATLLTDVSIRSSVLVSISSDMYPAQGVLSGVVTRGVKDVLGNLAVIRGAYVIVLPQDESLPMTSLNSWVGTTSDLGQFKINLEPGTYSITTYAPGNTLPLYMYPTVTSQDTAIIQAGSSTSAKITLPY